MKWPAPDGADVRVAVRRARARGRSARAATRPRRRRRPSGSSPPARPQIPPETPASTKWMPLLGRLARSGAASRGSSSCRRRRSCRRPRRGASSSWNVPSVIFPAGTIIQNARGASSWSRSSSSVAAVDVDAGVVRLHVVARLGRAGSSCCRPCGRGRSSRAASRRPPPVGCARRGGRARAATRSRRPPARGSAGRSRTAGRGSSARRRSPRRPAGRRPVVRAALVELAGRVQVARAEAVRDDAAGRSPSARGEPRDPASFVARSG